jgi:hypothetical protein
MAVLSVIPPVLVVAVVLGALWVAVVSVALPPPLRVFPRILLAGIVGSVAGQLLAEQLDLGDPLFGDAHLLAISVGGLIASSVVRRFSA